MQMTLRHVTSGRIPCRALGTVPMAAAASPSSPNLCHTRPPLLLPPRHSHGRIIHSTSKQWFPSRQIRKFSTSSPHSAASSSSSATASIPTTSTDSSRQSHIRLRPQLDLRRLRDADTVDAIQRNIVARGSSAFVDGHHVARLYERYNSLEFQTAQARKKKNMIGKRIFQAKTEEEKQSILAEATSLKEELSALEAEFDRLGHELEHEASKIPNDTSSQTPIGPEGCGRVLRIHGSTQSSYGVTQPQDHLSLCHRWQLVDFEAGSMVSGSRFYFLQHELALLEVALVSWSMSFLVRRGFTPVLPPDLIRSNFVAACGFQPRDMPIAGKEGEEGNAAGVSQIYHVAHSDLSLAGTAEIPLASMYAQREFNQDELAQRPIKHVAFGHAFRTEAGGTGTAIRGLYRVHQFSKVEMFAITTPEMSESMFDEIVSIQEAMYKELGLCFRVLEIPSEDLGAPAYRKIDCESWMPGRIVAGENGSSDDANSKPGSFGEISSASNCTDYQARRLNIKLRDHKQKKFRFVHTLNGTACAIPRLLISILEQHQQPDGSIRIPEVLRPFACNMQAIPDRALFPHRQEQTTIPSQHQPQQSTAKKLKKQQTS